MNNKAALIFLIFPIFLILLIVSGFGLVGQVDGATPPVVPTPRATPIAGHVATAAELQKAGDEWSGSRHANTFDAGQGANTTCARCKSPRNWDPNAVAAQEQALDCTSCKRVPGAPRAELEGGTTVPQEDWQNVGCAICHVPVGGSYLTSTVFWNQGLGQYQPVSGTTELCAKCHEGKHGFEVIEEQAASSAHKGWDCTKCHGAHGAPAACTDCHDPTVGNGAPAHTRHAGTNCTACHDAGGLSIWKDAGSKPKHVGTYITIRFAHALTSWPSHDLQTAVDCRRCHHPQGDARPAIAATTCDNAQCHATGAVLMWCPTFPRNPAVGER